MKKTVAFALLFAFSFWSAGCRAGKESATKETKQPVPTVVDEDPGSRPRQITNQGGDTLVLYQPQVDDWKNFRELDWWGPRFPSLPRRPRGCRRCHSAFEYRDRQRRQDGVADRPEAREDQSSVVRSAERRPDGRTASDVSPAERPDINVSLDCFRSRKQGPFRSATKERSATDFRQLSTRDSSRGRWAAHPHSHREHSVGVRDKQSHWRLFFDKSQSAYFLLVGQQWLRSNELRGPWSAATALPKEMLTLPGQAQWADLKDVISATATDPHVVIPQVFYSERPAEVILF